MRLKQIVLVIQVVFLISISNNGYAVEIGDKLPNIVGKNMDGSIFSLSRAEKKPKIVNFFWVLCEPCKKEMPMLSKKEKKFSNVSFYSVHAEANPDTSENYKIKDIKSFLKKLTGYPDNVILGSDRLKHVYSIKALPVTFLVNKENVVENILTGYNIKTVKKMESWLIKQ